MSIHAELTDDPKVATLKVQGPFGFSLVQEFRESYQQLQGYEVVIDFREASYIDSAGLGMLLNMKKYLGKDDGEVTVINCMPQIRKILLISRFDKKFAIR